ncbi:hypothetical protein HPB48_004925 [Haemaphysalis longicornis]|uniref:Uncharacterized protein n=1 Tax=Haemaphysalis longicornis TaxID=44386 RepID=A0A9J6GFQ5_HAELO|nr:hypothetical protein HPB48_004925 [Haemaphysalis longicornis]
MAAIMNGGKQPASMPLPPHLGSAAAAAAGSCFSGRYSPTYRAAPPDPMRARHCAMANAAPDAASRGREGRHRPVGPRLAVPPANLGPTPESERRRWRCAVRRALIKYSRPRAAIDGWEKLPRCASLPPPPPQQQPGGRRGPRCLIRARRIFFVRRLDSADSRGPTATGALRPSGFSPLPSFSPARRRPENENVGSTQPKKTKHDGKLEGGPLLQASLFGPKSQAPASSSQFNCVWEHGNRK